MSLLPPRKRKGQPTATSGGNGGNLPPSVIMPVIDDCIIRNVAPDYELTKLTGLKVSTVYKHAALGTFPPQVKITGRASGWRWSQVKQWIDGKRDWRAAQ